MGTGYSSRPVNRRHGCLPSGHWAVTTTVHLTRDKSPSSFITKNRGMSPSSRIQMRRADFLRAQPVANHNYYQFASWHFIKKTSQSFRISNNSSLSLSIYIYIFVSLVVRLGFREPPRHRRSETQSARRRSRTQPPVRNADDATLGFDLLGSRTRTRIGESASVPASRWRRRWL